jgi:DNA-binding NtrC family response regulator
MNVLILDDQRSARLVLRKILRALPAIQIVEASSLEQAKATIEQVHIDLALVDIRLKAGGPDRGGLELLEWLRATGRHTPTVMVTSSSEITEIRAAMRLGAQDYVLKDELCPEMLLPIVEGLTERQALRGEVQRLRERLDDQWGVASLVGSSEAMDRVRRLVKRVADADAMVLLRGETGSGKELVARAIHQSGRRASEPFLAVNCSALPGTLIESLIFGHEKGAFTGADRRMRGQLELAGAGTVLLDEIAEMPVSIQAKLLRVIEARCFRPLGAEQEQPLRARLLAATHVDIESRIRDGRFREDLYYRLNVVTIDVPSLAERADDIIELLHVFTRNLPRPIHFTVDGIDWLRQRAWPGNVRELKNAIDRVALLSDDDRIDVAILKELVGEQMSRNAAEVEKIAREILALPERLGNSKLDLVERAVLHHAIESCQGNKSAAARLVGVHRKQLDRRLDRLSSDAPPHSGFHQLVEIVEDEEA